MKLRELPGALALGLLASLVAHAALFGGEHEMGGAYHAQILTMALAAFAGLLASFGALAWSGAARAADGSVLGARLAGRIPGFLATLASSGLWLGAIECVEPAHVTAAVLPMLAALAAAAWLVLALCRAGLRVLARAVIAIARTPFEPRRPAMLRRAVPVLAVKPAPLRRRRFARPPPR